MPFDPSTAELAEASTNPVRARGSFDPSSAQLAEPSDKARFMESQTADSAPAERPRWDVVGDVARAGSEGVEATKQSVSEAFAPRTPRQPDEGFVDSYMRHMGEDLGKLGSAAMIPLNALSTLASPAIGGARATLGSALSYIMPGTNTGFLPDWLKGADFFNKSPGDMFDAPQQGAKERADSVVDLASMGLRPRAATAPAGTPAPPLPPAPGAAAPRMSLADVAQIARQERVPGEPVPTGGAPATGAPPEAAPTPDAARGSPAIREIVKRLDQDVKGGGMTADEILAEHAKTPDKPLTLADLGGENVKALAGNVSRTPGPSRQIVKDALDTRDQAAGPRLRENLDAALGEGSAYETAGTLMQQREKAAAPLYKAYREAPPMAPDAMAPDGAIGGMLNRPSMRAGMANAVKIAAEKGVDMKTLGITLDEAGEPKFTKVPTWETMDFVKAGVDDVVEAYRNKVTGKLDLDRYGSAANQTRADLISAVDKMNPAYKSARDAWAGPSQSLDTVNFGRQALHNEPEANAARLASMAPADREFARLGLKADLVKRLESAGAGSDEAKRLVRSEHARRQMEPFFRDTAEMDRFVAEVEAESRMFETRRATVGGPDTARRVHEDASRFASVLSEAVGVGREALRGSPTGVIQRGIRLFNELRDMRRTPEVNAEIATLLMEPLSGGPRPSNSMKLLQDVQTFNAARAAQKAPPPGGPRFAAGMPNFMPNAGAAGGMDPRAVGGLIPLSQLGGGPRP